MYAEDPALVIALLVGPSLGRAPRSLLLRRHPRRDVTPHQWQHRLTQPCPKLDPEEGSLRHEKRPVSELRKGSEQNNYITNLMTSDFDSLFYMVRRIEPLAVEHIATLLASRRTIPSDDRMLRLTHRR